VDTTFTSWIVHTHIHWMLSWMSCVMCMGAVSCQIDLQSTLGVDGPGHHVHQTQNSALFPLGPPQRSCVPHHPAHCPGVASRNLSWCWRDHSWQLYGLLTASPKGQRIPCWMCSHDDHVHTNSPWKWAFIHVSCFCTLKNYKYTVHQNCCMLFWILCVQMCSPHILCTY
jgi:hypothetical protein